MKKIIFIMCLFMISCSQKTVPLFLRGTIKDIDKNLNDTLKFDFKTYPEYISTSKQHFGLGLSIRNERKLWRESLLKNWFRLNGINHPDDMSGIILTTYHRKLNEKDINFREQKQFYKTYWKLTKKSKDSLKVWYDSYKSTRIESEKIYSEIFRNPRNVMGYEIALSKSKKDYKEVKYIAESISIDKHQINLKVLYIESFNDEYNLSLKVDDTIKVFIDDIYLIPLK
ncbi:MAG TPA: hypothetical protein PLL09_02260 [Flavobacterium sp.]|uniref:DUF6794 domain-containing protein n=1 Tax=unclassified Flavobacterium TaxID=196869 RepID=UPI0025C68FAA|nr:MULTISPECIES: DUF6794 domain-containing protein [unclassified Flavobacterium]HRE76627.1 hypothetical protein [Flavobacterium sp.]